MQKVTWYANRSRNKGNRRRCCWRPSSSRTIGGHFVSREIFWSWGEELFTCSVTLEATWLGRSKLFILCTLSEKCIDGGMSVWKWSSRDLFWWWWDGAEGMGVVFMKWKGLELLTNYLCKVMIAVWLWVVSRTMSFKTREIWKKAFVGNLGVWIVLLAI